jgi:hypothetical protein
MVTASCEEGAGACSAPAAGLYHGLTTTHLVCLLHAQRHRTLDWPGTWVEWLAPLPGSELQRARQ